MFGSNKNSAILRGEAAGLSGLRAALSSDTPSLLDAALEPFLRGGGENDTPQPQQQDNESSLLLRQDVFLSWQMEDEEQQQQAGYLVVTRQACLFCAAADKNNSTMGTKHDWFVPATSITLHALTGGGDGDDAQTENEASSSSGVYVQMENPVNDDNDG